MPKRPITAEDLTRLVFVGDPQISPDGHRILFHKKTYDAAKNKYRVRLCAVDLEGHIQTWTGGEDNSSGGKWSPDGRHILFTSGREGKKSQFYLLPTTGGEAVRLSDLPEGSISDYVWSPNSKLIAFTFREAVPQQTEAAKKEREDKGLSEPPKVIESMWYRLDGDGYFLQQRYALYILDVETGEHRKLYTECPMGFYSFDWSPASDELIVALTGNSRPMFERPNDILVRVNLEGQQWLIPSPGGSKDVVKWSPDGKRLAYLGNKEAEHWGAQHTRLYILPAEGGEAFEPTADIDLDLAVSTLSDAREVSTDAPLAWSPDSKALYVQVGQNGSTQIGFVQVDKPGVEVLTSGDHVLMLGNLSRDGERLACVWGDPTHPNEVGVYDLSRHEAKPEVLTRFNAEFLDEVKLSKPEEIWLDGEDGKVHAWVMHPIEYLPPRRYPAILEVHGGPHAQYGWNFFHEFQMLAAEGYVVVYSNPRGSQGYGEKHLGAISGKWGTADWEDIQTVTRWMQHQPYIHPGLMGIMGGSYGGYMTNWAIGHCKDFKAAITDRCVSNLVSFAGNHDFVMVKDGYFPGAFFGDTSALVASSPITFFEGVDTPTLIIHSEGDLRCNVEQAEQVFCALQHQGVESRFVRYPTSSSHGLSRNGPMDLRQHRLGEIRDWWARHLKS